MIDYKKELNAEQLDAVLGGDGPCLVLAGAGSGKTRVIAYRAAYLLEKGIAPENILLVTFTNKAAAEMTNRISGLFSRTGTSVIPSEVEGSLGRNERDSSAPLHFARNDSVSKIRLPWSGTFHHIANKILRIYAPLLGPPAGPLRQSFSEASEAGYKNNFSVLDTDDAESLIKLCSKNFKSEGAGQRFPSASVILNIVSYSRNAELPVEEVLDAKYPQWMPWAPQIVSIAADYGKKKREANAMDFDDLLVNFLLLLNDEKVLAKYAEQFQYILADEYQDTNKIQASIIDRLASKHKNIFVVGDDAQSIYSFRAADVGNILNFEKKYPSAKIFKLETNYRSTPEILELANNVIANNAKQYKKRLRAVAEGGVRPLLTPAMDQAAEAELTAEKIEKFLEKGTGHSEIAVLFRAAHHSQMLEMELMKRGIAYDYRGGVRFFERAHVKDILSYLRVINNLDDTAAWFRILTKEEGIGPAGATRVIEEIKKVVPTQGRDPDCDIGKEIKDVGFRTLGEKAKNGWNGFVRIWERLLGIQKKPAEMILTAVESGYKDFAEAEYIDAKDRLADLRQLAEFAKKYEDLESFLAESALQEGFQGNNLSRQNSGAGNEKIILSTIHQAKGLEWEKVFVINLSSGGFPNERALREENGLEEERRLFYVAITRAKKDLILTYPLASGGAGDMLSGPSMFLSEISDNLLDDKSILSDGRNLTIYNDKDDETVYVPEDMPKIRPGSFLRDVEDL